MYVFEINFLPELIRTPDPWVSAAMAWKSLRLARPLARFLAFYVVDRESSSRKPV